MKKPLLFIAFLAAFLPGAAQAEAARYYIPPPQFDAELEAMDSGLANVFGLFRNATGSFEFDTESKSIGNVRIALDSTSLIATNPDNARALMGLLGVMQTPEIDFAAPDSVSFKDGKADIKGTLTLHGSSKPFVMQATLNHTGKSALGSGMWGGEGEAAGISMQGTFKRADFSLSDDPNMPNRFGDSVTLKLEMQAIKQ